MKKGRGIREQLQGLSGLARCALGCVSGLQPWGLVVVQSFYVDRYSRTEISYKSCCEKQFTMWKVFLGL